MRRPSPCSSPLTAGGAVAGLAIALLSHPAQAADEEFTVQPDAVVTATLAKNDARLRFIIAGADAFENCSTITFDKPKLEVRLSCVPR